MRSASRRIGILFGVVVLLVFSMGLVPTLTAQAQDSKCHGLSKDDCALLEASAGPAMAKLSAFNMDYEITFKGSGLRGNAVDFSVKGSGPFEFTGAMPAGATGAGGAAMLAGAALDKLTMANTMSASLTTTGKDPVSGNFEFRILNGTLYFQGDKATQGKWRSVDLKKAMTSGAFRRNGFLGRGSNPAQALQGLRMLGEVQKLVNTPGFLTIERTADQTIDNQQIATFVYKFDAPTLFNSPDFAAFVKTAMAANPAMSGRSLSDAQLKAMGPVLAKAFANSTFTLTRLIGVTDKLPHGLGVDVVVKIDPAIMRGMMGVAAGGAATPEANATAAQPIDVNLHFLVKLTGIGTKVNVEAPTGATPLDFGPFAAGTPEANATMEATPAQ